MPNILFTYFYRDSNNHKTASEIIFANPDGLTLSEIEYKTKCGLTDQEYFHPNLYLVGVRYFLLKTFK